MPAFWSARLLERRFVGFSTDIPAEVKATRLVGGMLGYYAVALILIPLIRAPFPKAGATLVSCFIQMFYIVFVFPLVFALLEKRRRTKS